MTDKEDKKAAIHEIYDVDDFIDAKDNQGDWRVGYIIDKNNLTKTFKVRFDGWAAKYDEVPALQYFRFIALDIPNLNNLDLSSEVIPAKNSCHLGDRAGHLQFRSMKRYFFFKYRKLFY